MAKRTLTTKQQAVLSFIQQYLNEQRQAPLIREIQAGCQIESYKSVIDRLNALERKGYITRAPNKHRAIKVVKGFDESTPPSVEHSQILQAPAAI